MPDVVQETEIKMKKTIEAAAKTFAGVRTGRASPALLDNIVVEYYGALTPLKQLAQISVPEPRMMVVQAYDKNALKDIERAIQKSDLGINPMIEGGVVRLILPQLTQERRRDLVKLIKNETEKSKISLRNIRREVIDALKKQKENKEISEDVAKSLEEKIQKVTDKFSAEIDKLEKNKEAEIMEV